MSDYVQGYVDGLQQALEDMLEKYYPKATVEGRLLYYEKQGVKPQEPEKRVENHNPKKKEIR